MNQLTHIEKGAFLRLFNNGGCVLDFSTNDFDNFTFYYCIGVALCQHYGFSKGKSLTAYVNEAKESDVIKLFTDLLTHFETHCYFRCERDESVANLYARCRTIIDRISNNSVPLADSAKAVAQKFSSDYLSAQIKLMLEMTTQNPTEAIGKAKEFMATIRNAYGSGHGKSANYKGLEERHAKLAVGSSITLVQFLWDSHETQIQKSRT
jgi:hypothetical protein